jgi:hypothetical protein
MYDSNDTRLGTYISGSPSAGGGGPMLLDAGAPLGLITVSAYSYTFMSAFDSYFTTPDCTGTAYQFNNLGSMNTSMPVFADVVGGSTTTTVRFYRLKAAAPVTVDIVSTLNYLNECVAGAPPFYPVSELTYVGEIPKPTYAPPFSLR